MVRKLAVVFIVVAALLLPPLVGNALSATTSTAGQLALNTSASSSLNSISNAAQSAAGQERGTPEPIRTRRPTPTPTRRPTRTPTPRPSPTPTQQPKCSVGAWASQESVAAVRRGGYVHVDSLTDATRYFPGLSGKGVIRGLRCPSLQCMRDLAEQLRAHGIPFDAFCYDLEGWDKTPQWEREHQVEATQQARALADEYGVKLVMGPARAFTWRNWPQMAPYADMWVIQAQGGQRSYPPGAQFANWLSEYVDYLDTNPNLSVWAQLSTVPDEALTLEQYMAYVDSVKPSLIDGLYVFNPQDHLPLASVWNAECGR